MIELADFDGVTYEPSRDRKRLSAQYDAVFNLMKDGRFRTLTAIAMSVHAPEQSVGARLRDFRKEKFGSHKVEKYHLGAGLWKYRLIVNRGDKC